MKEPKGFGKWVRRIVVSGADFNRGLGETFLLVRTVPDSPCLKLCIGEFDRSVTDPRDGKRVALKKMPNVFQSLVSSKRVFRELKMLCSFKHDNVMAPLLNLYFFSFPSRSGASCFLTTVKTVQPGRSPLNLLHLFRAIEQLHPDVACSLLASFVFSLKVNLLYCLVKLQT